MSQHDLNLANNTGLGFRNDLNLALAAIATNQSGTSAPIGFGLAGPYAYQTWIDTNGVTEIYKIYNGASWVTLFDITGNNADYFAGNVTLRAQGELRLSDSDSSNYLAFRAPSTVASNVTWTFPAADGINRQALITDGAGGFNFAHAGGALYYRLDSDRALANLNTAQDVFGVGVSLAASTVYEFEGVYILARPSAAFTTHGAGIGFAEIGLTVNNISYLANGLFTTSSGIVAPDVLQHISTTANTSVANSIAYGGTSYPLSLRLIVKGTISTNAAGSLKPQITFTAAPGSSQVYAVKSGSYFKIWPIGSAGSNSSAGTWS